MKTNKKFLLRLQLIGTRSRISIYPYTHKYCEWERCYYKEAGYEDQQPAETSQSSQVFICKESGKGDSDTSPSVVKGYLSLVKRGNINENQIIRPLLG